MHEPTLTADRESLLIVIEHQVGCTSTSCIRVWGLGFGGGAGFVPLLWTGEGVRFPDRPSSGARTSAASQRVGGVCVPRPSPRAVFASSWNTIGQSGSKSGSGFQVKPLKALKVVIVRSAAIAKVRVGFWVCGRVSGFWQFGGWGVPSC